MTNYVLLYKGGGVPATEEEQQRVMAAWGAWYEKLGQAVVDGGNPFGPSKAIGPDGTASDGAPSGMTGYSIVQADSLDAATELGRSCPIIDGGGTVEVYETFRVM
jgi:YCII-related domain